MTAEAHYYLVSRDGVAVIHRNPRRECGLDTYELARDAEVTEWDAEALLLRADAKACATCWPLWG